MTALPPTLAEALAGRYRLEQGPVTERAAAMSGAA